MSKKQIAFTIFENYTQIQKLNGILKTRLNNDKLTPGSKKSRHFEWLKQNGALEFAVRSGYSHCVQTLRM